MVIHAGAISGGDAEVAHKANTNFDRLLSDKVRPDTVIFNASD
jgi:hypothetical protein